MGDIDAFDEQLVRAYRTDTEAFQVATRVLSGVAQQVRNDGATPVVILFGRRQEAVIARHGEPRFYAPLKDALVRQGIATIDVSDWLARAAQRKGMEQLFGSRGHYSPDLNQIVATELARALPPLVAPTCGTGQ